MSTPRVSLEFDPAVASTMSNVTVNNFVNMFKANTLVLRPPYQRNLVWNEDQQSFLVDSILRGLPVPEIYAQTSTTADGEESTVVVDGQQRITTCLRFVLGELRLHSGEDLGHRWRGRIFSELDDDLKKRFRSFALVVRFMPEIGEMGLREIFRRLNKTVEALEAQELRHAAYTGPFIQLAEKIAAHPALNEVGVFSAKDYLRRRSDEFVAEILYAIYLDAFPNKKEGLDSIFKTFERSEIASEPLRDLERRMGRVLDQIAGIAPTLRRTRFRNKSDFYSLTVFLARTAESLPVPEAELGTFVSTLKDFSGQVNEIKRLENAGESDDAEPADDGADRRVAVKYLRAVERAASDRLNRVRRNAALAEVLSTLVMTGEPRPLTEMDSAWLADTGANETLDEDEDDDTIEGRVQAQRALAEEDSNPAFPTLASSGESVEAPSADRP